ncbi:MAG: nucleotidyltransferase domain-containing protein [Verrucomicrobia bacterium]|nr:nucleotidyltransferase domain-containing protein [Verrucomicrobiota bacterium]
MFGLTSKDIQSIVEVLKRYPEIEEAIVFGSRALNRHKKGSDIDIALKGKNIDSIAAEVAGLLNDESPLPYYFDIVDYHTIDNPDLRDHIDRVGQKIYNERGQKG